MERKRRPVGGNTENLVGEWNKIIFLLWDWEWICCFSFDLLLLFIGCTGGGGVQLDWSAFGIFSFSQILSFLRCSSSFSLDFFFVCVQYICAPLSRLYLSHAHASFEMTPLDSTCSNSQPSSFEQPPAKSFHRRTTSLQPIVKSIPDLRKGKTLLLTRGQEHNNCIPLFSTLLHE